MSGFEIVGVVLGVVPLILSTVNYFDKTASHWKLLANTDDECRKVWNQIEDEKLLYHQQLRKLLAPLIYAGIFTKDEVDALVQNPERDFKKTDSVDAALKQRLGATHQRYLEVVTEVQILCGRLLPWLPPKIAVEPKAGQVDTALKQRLNKRAYTWLIAQLRRYRANLKFAFLRGRQTEVLQEIHGKIKLLGQFLVSSDEITALGWRIDVHGSASTVTLFELLQPSSDLRFGFTYRLRLGLALKVASYFEQNRFGTLVTSRDIRFPRLGYTAEAVLWDQPNISLDVPLNLPNDSSRSDHFLETAAQLAIMIVELMICFRSEDLQIWDYDEGLQIWKKAEYRKASVSSRRLPVARYLHRFLQDDVPHSIDSAIEWCLQPAIMTMTRDQWHRNFECEVICPMKRYLEDRRPEITSQARPVP